MNSKRVLVWAGAATLAASLVAGYLARMHHWNPGLITIEGAVIRRDADAREELPIAGAEVTASEGTKSVSTLSDASGYFALTFKQGIWLRRNVNLTFRHPGYQPLTLSAQIRLRATARTLYVAAMEPIPTPAPTAPGQSESVLSNVRIRYTVNTEKDENIGSAVKTFQVINQGNVPCDHQTPCSPNGLWKASIGSTTLDAGAGNEFRNVRASCIAGPCPFTRIDAGGFIHGGRSVTASAIDWSDTTTFLLEAEVFHTTTNGSVRESYPVLYGRTLNFTLPASEEGVSIEAEMNGAPMVFPLGPDLYLSWANCVVRTNAEAEKSTVYRCELKPGYRF